MARPRKPTALLELNGAFRHDPQRTRVDPEDDRPFGDPPEDLTPEQVVQWHRIVRGAIEGVLKFSDRISVEWAAELLVKKKIGAASSAELTILRGLLNAFGMDPSGRAKLSIPKKTAKNEFADLAEEARGSGAKPN